MVIARQKRNTAGLRIQKPKTAAAMRAFGKVSISHDW
jgi:hypothetical protein